MEISNVHLNVLDLAIDKTPFFEVLQPVVFVSPDNELREIHPGTSEQETRAAALELLRAGLISVVQNERELSIDDAEAALSDVELWAQEGDLRRWTYELVATSSGVAEYEKQCERLGLGQSS